MFLLKVLNAIFILYSWEKTKFRKQNGRKCQYLDENGKWKSTGKDTIAEAKQWYYSGKGKDKITFSEISNTMSDEKVMLLIGHKAWRSCYDQRNPEQVIKKLKTM